jgi:hypothetical protein
VLDLKPPRELYRSYHSRKRLLQRSIDEVFEVVDSDLDEM